jgi:DNA-binding LytR/AlgR family response regulator
MNLKCIIVDDEPMARNGIAEELREIEFVEIAGIAGNAYQAIDLLTTLHPDLMFLDIEMPGLNGLSLIKSLPQPPMIIIITAYPEYALEGYELDIVDYLIKPVNFSRLLKACCRAKEFHELKLQASLTVAGNTFAAIAPTREDYLFIRYDGRHEKILFQELLVLEAADNYVIIYTTGRKFMVYDTLKNMAALLPESVFMKVHKSFIVAVDRVSSVEGGILTIKSDSHTREFKIPVSRNLKEAVLNRIVRK